MASLLNMSGGSLLNKGLPYDAEIEYLESSITQYINIGTPPTLDTEIQCVVIPIDPHTDVISTDFKNTFGIHITNWASGSWTCYFGNKGYIPLQYSEKFKYFTPQSVIINYQKVTIDGVEYPINATSMSGTTMYMFKDEWGTRESKTRICSLKIKQNNILVKDFIPVRVGTTGYMYDKVSGQLFGNAGTGEFILGPDKHKEFIDLGLPSGTLWAKGNIIKNNQGNYSIGKPTDKGCYFSWGNIDGHNEGEEYNFSQDVYNTTPGATLTGNISPTDAEHDAAVAKIGEWCHIPTKDQFVELCNDEYTDKIGTTQNGVDGLLITSKINGNSIFLPEAGFYNGTSLYPNGIYWSSTFNSETNAYNLFFLSDTTVPTNTVYRCWGLTVRPVIS